MAGAGLRRASVGDTTPIVIPLGMMLLVLMLLSVVFKKCKQSNIIACIIIGGAAGALDLDEKWQLSRDTMNAFIELAIVLVLFTGGLELDVASLQKYIKLTLISGCGQIVIQWSLFMGVGAVSGLVSGLVSIVFFGLVCTFSSTILVLSALRERNDMESLHGQIILGTMVLQDVLAVLALCIIPAFEVVEHGSGNADVVREIAIVFGVLASVTAVLWILSKYFLRKIFDFFASDGEMLFIGTMGFAIGVAGLCAMISPHVAGLGAFFSGISLSSLPYKLEMEKKCEPIRAFGIVLFFFMLGIDLDITVDSLKEAIPFSILISLVILLVSPFYMTALGYMAGVRARTAWFTGSICNQISEFGLILGQVANHVGVFDDRTFQVVTFSMLLTFFFSSLGHAHADRIFQLVRPWLLFMDRRSHLEHLEDDELHWHDHIVLLGFNETGLAVAEFYRHKGKDVLMIELDPLLFSTISGLRQNGKREVSAGEGTISRGNVSSTDGQPVNPRKELEINDTSAPSLIVGPVSGGRDGPTVSADNCVEDAAPALVTKRDEHQNSFASLKKLLRGLDNSGDFNAIDDGIVQPVVTGDVKAGVQKQQDATSMDAISQSRMELAEIDAKLLQLLGPPEGASKEAGVGRAAKEGAKEGEGGINREVDTITSDHRGYERANAAGAAETSRGRGVEAGGVRGGISGQDSVTIDIAASHFGSMVQPGEQAEGGFLSENGVREQVLRESRRRSRTRNSSRARSQLQKLRCQGSAVDFAFGGFSDSFSTLPNGHVQQNPGSNIIPIYADPCAPETWEHYRLQDAALVVSCIPDECKTELALAPRLKNHGVPFLAMTNSDDAARVLYEAGVRYVVQQEALASVVVRKLLEEQWPETSFTDIGSNHKATLQENSCNPYLASLDAFL